MQRTVSAVLEWFVTILFAGVCCLFLLYALVSLARIFVTARVRLKSRDGFIAIFGLAVCLAFLNWIIGALVYETAIGGTALNGKVVADTHFLGSHGNYVEVSKEFWWFSYWYQIGTYASVGLCVAGAAIAWLLWGRKGQTPMSEEPSDGRSEGS